MAAPKRGLSSEAIKLAKLATKRGRVAKDKATIARSEKLKTTPNMTLGQSKIMKKGTKELARSTKKIAKKSARKGSYGNITIGESNASKAQWRKEFGTPEYQRDIPGLTERNLLSPRSGPDNLPLSVALKLDAMKFADEAKAYAASHRQAKRDVKEFKKVTQSPVKRTAKKVTTYGGVGAGAAGAGAYAMRPKPKPKPKPKKNSR